MAELRQEREEDYFETENVIREAFWNYYTPACSEHYLIHLMRESPVFVPELDIVAVENEKIIGSVMCMRSFVIGDDGEKIEVLSLGPIGVLPKYQRQGIGGKLLALSKKIATDLGFSAILLCGDPDYYTRQGFIAAETLNIRNSENMYADALHVCELVPNVLSGGRYFEDAIYNVDEEKVLEFDKQFPKKEIIIGTPTQKKFEMMVQRVRSV